MNDNDPVPFLVDQMLETLKRLDKLSQTGDAHALTVGTRLEAARLRGFAGVTDAMTRQRATDATREVGAALDARIESSVRDLSSALDRFTEATDRGGRAMFWLTVMLTVATFAQAIAAVVPFFRR